MPIAWVCLGTMYIEAGFRHSHLLFSLGLLQLVAASCSQQCSNINPVCKPCWPLTLSFAFRDCCCSASHGVER